MELRQLIHFVVGQARFSRCALERILRSWPAWSPFGHFSTPGWKAFRTPYISPGDKFYLYLMFESLQINT